MPKKLKRTTKLKARSSRKSIRSDNLHVPLTASTFRTLKTTTSRSSTARSESRREVPKIFSRRETIGERKGTTPREVPSNAAVHFASFYENEKLSSRGNDEKPNRRPDPLPRSRPKMEFTRQMVYTLEHSAGTEHYGQQVSAVLEKTVEAPEFDIKLPPLDKWAPFNESREQSYPLWYRDPSKLLETSMRRYSGAENENGEAIVRKIGVREALEKSRSVEWKIDGTFDDEDSAARCGERRFADRYVRSARSISSVGSEVALESIESSRITETANLSFSGGSESSTSLEEDGCEDEDDEDDVADNDDTKDNDGENEEDDARSSDEDDADRRDGGKKYKTSDSSGWETTEDEDDVVEMKIVNRKAANEKNRVSEPN